MSDEGDNRTNYTAEEAARILGVRASFVYLFVRKCGVPDECECNCIVVGVSRVWFSRRMVEALKASQLGEHPYCHDEQIRHPPRVVTEYSDWFGRWRINLSNKTVEHIVATPRFGWYVDLERCRDRKEIDDWERSFRSKSWFEKNKIYAGACVLNFREAVGWYWNVWRQHPVFPDSDQIGVIIERAKR